MINTYHDNNDKSDSDHDLMYSHQMGIKVGYNKRFDKFFILIMDYETKLQTKAYIDEPDYEEIGHSIIQNIKDIREQKEKEK
jgi:hypothetical protein